MRSKVEALLGSTMREVGILILVFAPQEFYLRGPGPPAAYVKLAVSASLILIVVGIILEASAERKR